jgi:hypothetical protein
MIFDGERHAGRPAERLSCGPGLVDGARLFEHAGPVDEDDGVEIFVGVVLIEERLGVSLGGEFACADAIGGGPRSKLGEVSGRCCGAVRTPAQ